MDADPVATDDHLVLQEAATPPAAGVTLAELLSSFYLWLLCWLVVSVAVPVLAIGWEPVLITSGSMGPTISPGDVVLLGEPPAPGDDLLQPGTVITFRDPGDPDALITHRIDETREDGLYRTRGDANGRPDSAPVAPDDIVGVGRMLVPLIGLPVLWLRTDTVSFLLFVTGTLAAVVVASTTHHAAKQQAGPDDTDPDDEDDGGGAP